MQTLFEFMLWIQLDPEAV
jgi:hypothetical protein